MVAIEGIKACYVAVALCVGITQNKIPTPVPNVDIIPGKNFECGTYEDGSKAYCAGLTDAGWVVAASANLGVLQHEFVHYVVQKRKLNKVVDDPGDGAHTGPWWKCDKRGKVPQCNALWE